MKLKTTPQISRNMSQIRSKGSLIEKTLATALRKKKILFRQHMIMLGKPDFIILRKKIAIFCDSSFWHGYRFLETSRHRFKSNKKFWTDKIYRNMLRDKFVNQKLRKSGWQVVRFWDFSILKGVDKCVKKIEKVIKKVQG